VVLKFLGGKLIFSSRSQPLNKSGRTATLRTVQ
jgi:hypothetical protein